MARATGIPVPLHTQTATEADSILQPEEIDEVEAAFLADERQCDIDMMVRPGRRYGPGSHTPDRIVTRPLALPKHPVWPIKVLLPQSGCGGYHSSLDGTAHLTSLKLRRQLSRNSERQSRPISRLPQPQKLRWPSASPCPPQGRRRSTYTAMIPDASIYAKGTPGTAFTAPTISCGVMIRFVALTVPGPPAATPSNG